MHYQGRHADPVDDNRLPIQDLHEQVLTAIRDAMAEAMARMPMPLPRGSHIFMTETGEPGVNCVAMRLINGVVPEVLTERGDWLRIDYGHILVMGDFTTKAVDTAMAGS